MDRFTYALRRILVFRTFLHGICFGVCVNYILREGFNIFAFVAAILMLIQFTLSSYDYKKILKETKNE